LIASAAGVTVSLSTEETEALLRRAPTALDAQVNEVLLTALAQTLARWSGERAVRINLESHGREESIFDGVNLTRTAGWFTTFAPALLDLGQAEGAEAELAAVKEQLQAMPGRGAGYGVLRYLGEDASVRERLRASDASAVTFNYLGRVDEVAPESGLFKFAAESAGPSMSREGRRASLLDINAVVVGGRLRCDWSFSQNLHRRETIERLAREFADALREFAEGPGGTDDSAAGLSDFNWGRAEAAEVAAALDNLES
jgi:non-ribosomal peptide synthase protein (TIGR01720 family)